MSRELTSATLLNQADTLLQFARDAGADAADALGVTNVQTHVSCRLGNPEDLERAESTSLGLRVWVGKQVASISTTDTAEATLRNLAEQAVAIARQAPEDPYAVLAPDDRLARNPDIAVLDLVDHTPEPSIAALQAQCFALEDAARAVTGVTNSEGASASVGDTTIALATSHGFAQSYRATSFSLSGSVLAGEGTGMERDWSHSSARHWADLQPVEEIGREAGERTVRRLNPRRVATCEVPVVFEWRVARSFLSTIAGAISGAAVANGASFLRDSMGQKVLADGITIVDDPLRVRGQASRPFDAEGVASARRVMIESGVLNEWFLDTRSALRLGMQTGGHAGRGMASPPAPGPSNLALLPGNDSVEAMLAEIGTGLFVTDAFGGGANIITGDYSQGVAGFWVENGQLAYPVSEITIAGKLPTMFANLQAADDLQYRSRVNSPTLCVGRMTVAGN
jgi:PmbA protein